MALRTLILGTASISAVRLVRLLANFITIPILSRLLSPAEYGLVAIAMPFALLAMMLADAGIGMSLVRVPLTERAAWSSNFWLTILFGIALSLAVVVLAPLAAYLFHEPMLFGMIAALGFCVFAQTAHVIPVTAIQQSERFHIIALIEMLCLIASISVAVWMAYHGHGAWSMVWQQIVYFALRMVLAMALSPFKPLWIFRHATLGEHLRFGRNVLGNSLFAQGSRMADNWIIGHALGAGVLGFYSMAFQFARLPGMLVIGPLQYVLYGQLVKLKDRPHELVRIYLLVTRLLAALIFPAMAMVAVAHEAFFTFVLSAKWATTGLLFVLVAPATALQAVVALSETLCFALERTELQMRLTAEFAVLWLGALLLVVHQGTVWACLTYTGCVGLYTLRYLRRVLPLLSLRLADYLVHYAPALLASAVAALSYHLLVPMLADNPLLRSGFAALLGLLACAVTLLAQKRALLEEVRLLRNTALTPEAEALLMAEE